MKHGPCQRAGKSLGLELGPQAFGPVVIEQDIALVQTAGDAKGAGRAVHLSGVDHPRLGQRSEGDHDGFPSKDIVHRLVPVQDLDGIGPGGTVHVYADDLI